MIVCSGCLWDVVWLLCACGNNWACERWPDWAVASNRRPKGQPPWRRERRHTLQEGRSATGLLAVRWKDCVGSPSLGVDHYFLLSFFPVHFSLIFFLLLSMHCSMLPWHGIHALVLTLCTTFCQAAKIRPDNQRQVSCVALCVVARTGARAWTRKGRVGQYQKWKWRWESLFF